jgi:hypothetical protein
MRPSTILLTTLIALAALAADRAPASAQSAPVAAAIGPSDPCDFFRGRAWGQGIGDYTTEMVWACEAIAARQAASVPLGPRLAEMAAALERFRAAVIDTGQSTFGESLRLRSRHLGVSRDRQHEIAAQTGVLAALQAIQTGF